ncbi:MAG: response regulator [Verrucomicrobiota bacterium]
MRRPPDLSYVDRTKVVTLTIDAPPLTGLPGAAPRPPQRVLLLEDRDDFRAVLRDHLTFRGFDVISVPSGVEGLHEIKKAAFDLIVCDMLMPRSGGEMFYWAVTRVRPATAQRFIFFTGHQNNPTIEFFFKRVNATVIRKPFRLSELDSRMKDVFGRLV